MSTGLVTYRFKPAFFQCLVQDEVNGNVSDSTDMAINRRAEVSVGVTGDGSYYFPGSGMTFAILTMQEVEMRITKSSSHVFPARAMDAQGEGGKRVARHEQKLFIL